MASITNNKIVLRQRPTGLVGEEHFEKKTEAISRPIPDGSILVKTLYVSIDPAMRGWLNDVKSYLPPVKIGAVMRAMGVGEIVESRNPAFSVGDFVFGPTNWQEYAVADGVGYQKISAIPGHPISVYLGVLGMTGLTACFGFFDIGKPKAGEVVLVSGAAGATGSVVGQLAKLHGCRVVGIAGSDSKCAWLKSVGFDEVINYKTCGDLDAALRATCPKGIDIYFDNVGGAILDAALRKLRMRGRVVLCGGIANYNSTAPTGPASYLNMIATRARMEGFIVMDYAEQYPEALAKMGKFMIEGKLKYTEDIVQGLDRCPAALRMLFEGANQGKMIVQIAKQAKL